MPSAKLDAAAMRIAWGKWMNAGQTCVAPDYVLVHESVRDELIERLKQRVEVMYGADPKASPDFGRIVNQRHFARIEALIDPAKVAFGGRTDAAERYVAPTVLKDVTLDDAVMQEEIFGPVLPVITIRSLDEAISIVRKHPNPLAFYAFTEDRAEADTLVERVSFGGGCINNVVLHLSDPGLPFGGVGSSGTGSYHGKHGFDCFSHRKAVLDSSSSKLLDLPIKYAPYAGKLSKLKWILG
jgi:aldehyde dehydrogenase (NAD+)